MMNYISLALIRKIGDMLLRPMWSGLTGALLLIIAYWITSLGFLAFFAFVIPLFAIQCRQSFHWLHAAKTGFWFGLTVCFACFPLLSFQPNFLNVLVGDPVSKIILSIKFLLALLLFGFIFGIAVGLLFAISFFISGRAGIFSLVVLPFLWAFWEIAFRSIAFGFDWWFIGIILANSPFLRQWVLLGGLGFLSWILVMCNVLIFFIIYHYIIQKQSSFPYPAMITSALLCIVVFVGGYILYHNTDIVFPLSGHVALFQPGVTNFPRMLPLTATREFSRYTDMLSRIKPDILIIPGQLQSKPILLDDVTPSFIRSLLGNLAEDNHLISIITIPLKEKAGTTSLALIALQQKKVVGVYRKEILMPVSDYRPSGPVGSIFPADLYGKISPFTGANGLFLPKLYAGALICNEIFFTRLIAKHKEFGARLLILSGNDAAFTSDLVSKETLRKTQIRAVENRIWIIRVGKTGISAVIDPRGDVVASISRGRTDILVYP